MHGLSIREIMATAPVIPVLTVTRLEHAVPLARALASGGLRVLEVTLRTAVGLAAIEGVGTLTDPDEFSAAARAGAQFGVSPGFTTELAKAAQGVDYPFLPGVMTPSELIAARQAGFSALKLFPAQPAGGIAMLKALAGPFPEVVFCPTGGITHQSAPDYLALPNVLCVGGSWVTPADRVSAGDWATIEALAREAAALPRPGA